VRERPGHPLTSFVGRVAELQRLESHLGSHRLVSVIGPGGCGKTRLVSELLRHLPSRFDDGEVVVPLAGLEPDGPVAESVAAAFRLPGRDDATTVEVLVGALAHRHTLLVLDNCEHVLGPTADLCEQLLAAADDLRILTTGRQALGVDGEQRLRLGPLPVRPGDTDEPPAAVRLFLDRAGLVTAPLPESPATLHAVTAVVEALDGMPLGIELAAAQLDVMQLDDLVGGIRHRLEGMISADRAREGRHLSLHASVGWSYDLLDADQQRVFRDLSVFAGPIDPDAAVAVAGEEAPAQVAGLVRRSLIVAPVPGADGRARYAMLNTTRAFAASAARRHAARSDPAHNDPAHSDPARRMAAWMAATAAEQARRARSISSEAAAAAWMDAEEDNLRAAVELGLERDAALAVALIQAMCPWLSLRGRQREAITLLERVARCFPEPVAPVELWLGFMTGWRSEYEAAARHFSAAISQLAGAGPSPVLVDAQQGISLPLLNMGRIEEGVAAADAALVMGRALGYRSGEVLACVSLAIAAHYEGDPERAVTWARAANTADAGEVSGYADRFRREVLGSFLARTGHRDEAIRVLTETLALSRQVGDRTATMMCLVHLAQSDLRGPGTAEHICEALALSQELGNPLVRTTALRLASKELVAANPQAAAVAAGASAAWLDRLMRPTSPIADLMQAEADELAEALAPDTLRLALERGARMSVNEIVAFVLDALAGSGAAPEAVPATPLSRRERELLALVAAGLTDAEIAGRLWISIRTVRSHLDRIRDKTGRRRRADLTRLAVDLDLV
jgi:predicted ATPase/DNA-binding CsgD family transcriptional regulator